MPMPVSDTAKEIHSPVSSEVPPSVPPFVRWEEAGSPSGEGVVTGKVSLETGFSYETIRALVEMGHKVGYSVGPYGGYQAILYDREQGVYYGASESRKDGQAAGY